MQQILVAAAIAILTAAPVLAQDMPLSQVLIEGEGWSVVGTGYETVLRLQGFTTGDVAVYDRHSAKRIDATDLKPTDYLSFGLDGDAITFGARGFGYGVSRAKKAILIAGGGNDVGNPKALSVPGLNGPSCFAFTADYGTLFVGDAEGEWIWAFRLDKDGSLAAGQPYCPLRKGAGQTGSDVSALTLDKSGRIYATTPLGVQIFDPTGRLCGVLSNPVGGAPIAIAFGGPDGKWLFVASKNTVYMRKVQVQGQSFDPNAKFTLPPAVRQK